MAAVTLAGSAWGASCNAANALRIIVLETSGTDDIGVDCGDDGDAPEAWSPIDKNRNHL